MENAANSSPPGPSIPSSAHPRYHAATASSTRVEREREREREDIEREDRE